MQTQISKLLLLLLLFFAMGVWVERFGLVDLDLVFCSRGKFLYINKELACKNSLVVNKHGYGELKNKLEDFISKKVNENALLDISIYFRDLKNGPTLGLNEHTEFTPASLLKVPILLTYMSLAERDPELFEKTLKFRRLKEGDLLHQSIVPKNSIEENISYTIRELLRHMIVYSDNNAYFTLVQYLNQQYPDGGPFFDTMSGLGIVQPKDFADNNLTVKSYGSIFVQLYHSSFFEKKETSEETLALLTKSDFKDGIVAGVPSYIPVAHKFGERILKDKELKQFHDCGIVYYPKNPYLLCVMTRGHNIDQLTFTISAISKMFYEEFDSRKIR
jgi:beta-lactamase class A